jgi:hypothetical protein
MTRFERATSFTQSSERPEFASVVSDDLLARVTAEVPALVPQKYRPAVQEALRRLVPDKLQTLLIEEGHAEAMAEHGRRLQQSVPTTSRQLSR